MGNKRTVRATFQRLAAHSKLSIWIAAFVSLDGATIPLSRHLVLPPTQANAVCHWSLTDFLVKTDAGCGCQCLYSDCNIRNAISRLSADFLVAAGA